MILESVISLSLCLVTFFSGIGLLALVSADLTSAEYVQHHAVIFSRVWSRTEPEDRQKLREGLRRELKAVLQSFPLIPGIFRAGVSHRVLVHPPRQANPIFEVRLYSCAKQNFWLHSSRRLDRGGGERDCLGQFMSLDSRRKDDFGLWIRTVNQGLNSVAVRNPDVVHPSQRADLGEDLMNFLHESGGL